MDAVKAAKEWYEDAIGELAEQRQQIEEDLEFSDPSNPQQWDHDERRRRENDPGGARPCLVFDQIGQYIQNVTGQFEQRPPALHTMPVDGGADIKVSESLDGFLRHIEYASRARDHYARAQLSAARAGVGYLIVRPEYVDRALGYQEPRISSEGDPLRVVFDPWSVELDGSDADQAIQLLPYSAREFKRRWPKAEAISFHSGESRNDSRESIIVADVWTVEEEKKNIVSFLGIDGDEISLPEDDFWKAHQRQQVAQIIRAYTQKTRCIYWRRMSGDQVLETSKGQDGKESPFPADGIGIVPMYGYVGWTGGRMRYCGMPRRARDPQRAYNWAMSEARAYMANAPKSPWIGPDAAFAPYKDLWDNAAVQQRAYLPYSHVDEEGQPVPAPSRMPVAVNVSNYVQQAAQAKDDIQAALGMYAANIGQPSNETSGVAINERKQQGEASTALFNTNPASSIARVGRLCLEMIPRLIDTGRQLRILGMDGAPGHVRADPQQGKAYQETRDGVIINPNIGRYDARVVVGAAYATQRSAALATLTEAMRNPALAPAIAPMWAQNLDVKGAEKLAQALTAIAPDPVKAVYAPQDQGKPTTEQLMSEVAQLKQGLQEAIQIAQQAQAEAEQAKREASDKEEMAAAKEAEVAIKAYEAETRRLQVTGGTAEQIQAIAQQTVLQMLQQPAPMQETEDAQPEGMDDSMPEMLPGDDAAVMPEGAGPED